MPTGRNTKTGKIKSAPVRYDKNHVRLREGESERKNGTYEYRWTSEDGSRHSIYAPTIE